MKYEKLAESILTVTVISFMQGVQLICSREKLNISVLDYLLSRGMTL